MPDSVKGVLYDFNPRMGAGKAIAEFPLQDGQMVYEDTISRPRHLRFSVGEKAFPTGYSTCGWSLAVGLTFRARTNG